MINASGGFTPRIPGNVCGSICTTTHIPVTYVEYYIRQDSVIVDSFTTSSNGYFNVDIPFGSYWLESNNGFFSCERAEFIVDSFYNDYPKDYR